MKGGKRNSRAPLSAAQSRNIWSSLQYSLRSAPLKTDWPFSSQRWSGNFSNSIKTTLSPEHSSGFDAPGFGRGPEEVLVQRINIAKCARLQLLNLDRPARQSLQKK